MRAAYAPGCADLGGGRPGQARRRLPIWFVGLLAVVSACLVLLAGAGAPATAAVAYDAEELAFLRQLNEFRAANGRQPLLLSDQLSLTAEHHSSDMGKYKFFSHTTERSDHYPVGSAFHERLQRDGYKGAGTSGENLAAGSGTAAGVFGLWQGSSGHRANMLDPTSGGSRVVFKEVGIARVYVSGSPYGWYWATEFGGSLDATAHDPFAVPSPPGPFPDVPGNHRYVDAISLLSGKGVVVGFADGTFRPENPVWRQQFAKMIAEALDLPVDEGCVAPFDDVLVGGPGTFYPDNYVAVVAAQGITTGTAPGCFSPIADISRAQVVTMVVRAVQSAAPGVLKSPPAGYETPWCASLADSVHYENARLAAYNGLLAGLGSADVWAAMPRGEVAQVLMNLDVVLDG